MAEQHQLQYGCLDLPRWSSPIDDTVCMWQLITKEAMSLVSTRMGDPPRQCIGYIYTTFRSHDEVVYIRPAWYPWYLAALLYHTPRGYHLHMNNLPYTEYTMKELLFNINKSLLLFTIHTGEYFMNLFELFHLERKSTTRGLHVLNEN